VLSPFEIACLICRLGYLNLYNPCKPEGSYELDLSRREERILAKILCSLAVQEPGDNWTYQTFRWQRNMESMPGWQLTQPWLTEDGMPMRGNFVLSRSFILFHSCLFVRFVKYYLLLR
jgi:hypothetical protein